MCRRGCYTLVAKGYFHFYMNYCKINTPLFRMQQFQAAAILEMQALLKAQKQKAEQLKEEGNGFSPPNTKAAANNELQRETSMSSEG
jgi:hypothetical protein